MKWPKIGRGLTTQIGCQKWSLREWRFWQTGDLLATQIECQKRAPWRVAILAKMAKFCKNGEFGTNGKKSLCPLENGDFGENGDFVKNGTTGEKSPKGCRYPECGKYSNWMPKVAPSNYITKEVPITVRKHFSKKFQVR